MYVPHWPMSQGCEVMPVATYTAVVERSGDWWAVRVREHPGVFTQVKRLEQVKAMAHDALVTFLDVDPADVDVEVVEELPQAAADDVRRARQARLAASAAQAEADDAMRTAAVRLVRSGLTVRDAGRVLGVSPQRISQLTRADAAVRSQRENRSA
jgi:predicted RNase H-like HicB family nuclease